MQERNRPCRRRRSPGPGGSGSSVNGERVIQVQNAEGFWQVYEEGEGEFLIEAPPGVGESLGFNDPEPRDA